jgi:DNA-binding transcriptional ArsR family regulator
MPGDKGQGGKELSMRSASTSDEFVLEKAIFSNVFEKDIQRVYIYKKAERLAKAVHLIAPAFAASPPLKARVEASAVGLIDSATLPTALARSALSRELLALSSALAMAETSGALSNMNAALIAREVQLLLAEVAAYEEPRLALAEAPSLAAVGRRAAAPRSAPPAPRSARPAPSSKGHLKDTIKDSARREAILGVIREKGRVYIGDISRVVQGVSEKTIQRELSALVGAGVVAREGERRWTLYFMP